jgi:hypothetical protein
MLADAGASTTSIAVVAESQASGWLPGSLIGLVGIGLVAALTYTFLMRKASGQEGSGIVRATLALVLVGGLMLLAGASFAATATEQTTNLLVGGIVASASSAVAFYFASRGAQDARRDMLGAVFGTETVPKLEKLSLAEAKEAMSRTSLTLEVPGSPQPTAVVKTQSVPAGTPVAKGTPVSVTVT